jgi:hypothetical protein
MAYSASIKRKGRNTQFSLKQVFSVCIIRFDLKIDCVLCYIVFYIGSILGIPKHK